MITGLRTLLQHFVVGWERWLWVLLGKLRKSERLWELIDRTGIVVFVGPNGSGKSLAGVEAVLRTLDGIGWECDQLVHHHNEPARRHWLACVDCSRTPRGRTGLCEVAHDLLDECGRGERYVYSTVPLLDHLTGLEHPRYRPLVDFRQLVTVEHSDVFFDEVAGVSDASDSAGVPVQVTNWLHQLRKRDVRLRVTTPAYARCSKPIRQVAQVVVDARAFFPELNNDGRLWRSRQAMLYVAYDAFAFGDYTPTTGDRLKSLAGAAFWRPGSRAEQSYDTLGSVLALGHVTEGGMCAVCGGSRSRPKCACDHSVDDVPAHLLEVQEKVSPAGTRVRTAVLLPTPDMPQRLEASTAGDLSSTLHA